MPPSASAVGCPLTGFSGELGFVAGEICGPPLAGDIGHRPHQFSSAPTVGVVPSASTPYALSVMLECVIVEVLAEVSRTPAPSVRLLAFCGVPATGAPLPCTRFCEIVSSVSAAVAPVVTRTPSWPKSGPLVSTAGLEQLPSA